MYVDLAAYECINHQENPLKPQEQNDSQYMKQEEDEEEDGHLPQKVSTQGIWIVSLFHDSITMDLSL